MLEDIDQYFVCKVKRLGKVPPNYGTLSHLVENVLGIHGLDRIPTSDDCLLLLDPVFVDSVQSLVVDALSERDLGGSIEGHLVSFVKLFSSMGEEALHARVHSSSEPLRSLVCRRLLRGV